MGERRRKGLLPGQATAEVDEVGEALAIIRDRDARARRTTRLSAGDILTLLRRHDIDCSIDSFAVKGWTARLGDPASGFYAQEGLFPTMNAAASWLLEEARRRYPAAF